ncbi:MAG: FadR/GntR family transcriptional regulator [Anaerolineae bacterium]|jgi:GntR family transcriptional repressor for pyruvate dehydrogenase complex
MPSEVSSSTLVDDVTEAIRQMIVTGEIGPGEFLPTRKELAAEFGVGLSTIQEAIQALSAVGMLASRPGKGTWVRQDALDGLIHPEAVRTRLGELNADKVYEARGVIEVALTEMAARRATPGDVERIWAAQERMEASVDDTEAFVAADLDFHLAVARASKNELLEQFYHLSRRLVVEVIQEMVSLPDVKKRSIPYQRAIVEAIERQDPILARQAAEEHMAYVDSLLQPWVD